MLLIRFQNSPRLLAW